MSFRSGTIHEDGSRTVRTVPGSIRLDAETGRLYNPESTARPSIRVQHYPSQNKENRS